MAFVIQDQEALFFRWNNSLRIARHMRSQEALCALDLCEAMRALMPADGEPIVDVGEIHAHVRGRCVDLLSGSAGELLLCADGPPWHAESDLTQARNLASIICSSNAAIELYLDFCRAEAAALVDKHNVSIRAVAAALIEHRTLTGEQIVAVVAESVAREAMAAERARRADWCESPSIRPRISRRREP